MSPEKAKASRAAQTPVDPIAASREATMISEDENDTGAIRISENVVAAIVHKYVLEVEGVVRFASGSLVGNIGEFFGRPDPEKKLQVDLADECVNISVSLVLEFGVHIPTVASEVQTVVRTKVEELTGKQVMKVNVTVQDLEDPKTQGEEGVPLGAAGIE
jgi:uncharacterized alkaline shock family protein YloU